MTLADFVAKHPRLKYIKQFELAWLKRQDPETGDPSSFPTELDTDTLWMHEYHVFVDNDGDADAPLSDQA